MFSEMLCNCTIFICKAHSLLVDKVDQIWVQLSSIEQKYSKFVLKSLHEVDGRMGNIENKVQHTGNIFLNGSFHRSMVLVW